MVCVETLADWWNEIGCISSVFSSKVLLTHASMTRGPAYQFHIIGELLRKYGRCSGMGNIGLMPTALRGLIVLPS